jgi:hypothetical protein
MLIRLRRGKRWLPEKAAREKCCKQLQAAL